MRKIRIVEGDAALLELDKLDMLLAGFDAPITARATWLRSYAESYADTVVPLVITVRELDVVVAMACLGRADGPIIEWTALGHSVSDYSMFPAVDRDAARMLAEAVAAHVSGGRRPWRLRLEQFTEGDPVHQRLREILDNVLVREGIPAARLTLKEPRELAAHVSKSTRRNRRRGLQRLADDGHDVSVVRTRDASEVRDLLAQITALRRSRDHLLRRRSDLDDPQFGRFYNSIIPALADQGELELHAVLAGDALIGYLVLFIDGTSFRTWDGRVRSGWTQYAAGRICDVAALESALEDPRITTFDWMRGVQEYKKSAMDHVVAHQHLHAWSSPLVRNGLRVAAGVDRRARRVILRLRNRITSDH